MGCLSSMRIRGTVGCVVHRTEGAQPVECRADPVRALGMWSFVGQPAEDP